MGLGSSTPKDLSGKPVVLVIGGGYGGIQCAQALDKSGLFNVAVLDRKDYFLHNMASLRTSAVKDYAKEITIPYTSALKHGVVLKADVQMISAEEGIKVNGKEEWIKFDYLVIATGSSYAFPGRIAESELAKAQDKYNQFYDVVQKSSSILVVGGGPVGVELAGEIASSYSDKTVRILSASDYLIPAQGASTELRDRLKADLEALKVEVILGDRVTDIEQQNEKEQEEDEKSGAAKLFTNAVTGKRTITTDKGKSMEVDLILFCTGLKVNSKIYETAFADKLDARKRLKSNKYLQVEGHKNIFVLGDCRANNAGQGYFAGLEAAVVAKNIIALAKSKNSDAVLPAEFDDEKRQFAMLVPVGPKKGASQFGTSNMGSTFTSFIKGSDLFVSRNWSMMGADKKKAVASYQTRDEADGAQQEVAKALEDNKAKNLAAAVGSSVEDAMQLWTKGGFPDVEYDETTQHT